MNKFKKYLTVALAGAAFFSIGAEISANAASWHSGTPGVLRGTWKAKIIVKDGYKSNDGETTIKKDSISQVHRFNPSNPQGASGLKYKYNGNGKYTVSSTAYNQGMKYKKNFHFKVYNKDKIYFSGFITGNYGDAATYYRS